MAFSCGFFNSKGLDRTYTAENFTDYLSSLICNGILDTYGSCFGLSRSLNSLSVGLGTGKAWIDGHYFINDASYAIDLTRYQDESLPRYVSIGIVLNTDDSVRDVRLDVIAGTPAESPTIPEFTETATKKRLHLYAIRVKPGATAFEAGDVTDYRENTTKCGYCKCILGKCKVSEMLRKLNELNDQIREYNENLDELIRKIDEIDKRIDDETGEVIEFGQCGEHINYLIYSSGKVFLRGNGAMYDYDSPISHSDFQSPFRDREDLKTLTVTEGITSIGDFAFENADNLESANFPKTLQSIGNSAFMHSDNYVGIVKGLKTLHIPERLTTLKRKAFFSTQLTSVVVPKTVTSVADYVFSNCTALQSARCDCPQIGDFMFTRCHAMNDCTFGHTVTSIGSNVFNYCSALSTLRYEGTLAEWQALPKGTSWDGHGGLAPTQLDSVLKQIQCLDGYMQYDDDTKEWMEVHD